MAYATYADLQNSLDVNIIEQLCSDDGTPVVGSNAVSDAALERGTATVRAYCRVGNIYTDTNLNDLATAGDSLLVNIVTDLAAEYLFQRRGTKIPPAIEQRIKQAYSYCEALRDGKMLFGGIESKAVAGTPEVVSVPLSNLAWYAEASNSQFFPPRRGSAR